ncbi:hypothetical protein [Dietzia sp. 179-F 9C3 NHS]|uniref:hypothetical protein n=1 Tax=Dietzia sp. 179-F 9C3 NHS TaxID=3374295 RepID=UPI003879638A
MSYAIGELRRWDAGGVGVAGSAVVTRAGDAEDARRILSGGREALADGWEGVAAEAVLDAADTEKVHVTTLAEGLHDLAEALGRAGAALAPAVQAVRDRIAEAEAAGLLVGDTSVAPAPGHTDIEQDTVDHHADAIRGAIDTVASLDEHYGREIDTIAQMLHAAVPAEVDRTPIPGPDAPWRGRAVDAVTAAMSVGLPYRADDIDPRTRGRHAAITIPDDVGRAAGTGMRAIGRAAGPLGVGLTVYGGIDDYASGRSTASQAAWETSGSVVGGMAGGAGAGAVAGSFLGPAGVIIGAGIGAVVGSWLGKQGGTAIHDAVDAN